MYYLYILTTGGAEKILEVGLFILLMKCVQSRTYAQYVNVQGLANRLCFKS